MSDPTLDDVNSLLAARSQSSQQPLGVIGNAARTLNNAAGSILPNQSQEGAPVSQSQNSTTTTSKEDALRVLASRAQDQQSPTGISPIEQGLRTVSGWFQKAQNKVFQFANGLSAMDNPIPDILPAAAKQAGEAALNTPNAQLQNAANTVMNTPPGRAVQGALNSRVGQDVMAGTNIAANVLPLASPILRGTYAFVEPAAEDAFLREWKLGAATARKQGPDKLSGMRSLADTWSQNNIAGQPSVAYDRDIPNAINTKIAQRDPIIQNFVAQNPNVTYNVNDMVDNLNTAFKNAEFPKTAKFTNDQIDQAFVPLQNVLAKKGFGAFDNKGNFWGAQITPDRIPELNQVISAELDPFLRDKFDDAGTLANSVARAAYYKNLTAFADQMPEAAGLNQDISKLITLREAAGNAAARMGNHNFLNIGDLVLGGIAASHGNIPMALAVAGRKVGSGGRFAGLLNKTANTLNDAGDAMSIFNPLMKPASNTLTQMPQYPQGPQSLGGGQ